MKNRASRTLIAVAALVAFALGGAALAAATGGSGSGSGDNADQEHGAALTSSERSAISAAALKATGGGKVNQMERDGENGATYEAEVAKPDGSTVDVRLDDGYGVVAQEADSEKSGPDTDTNSGPDTNANEPGHQDAPGSDGETAD